MWGAETTFRAFAEEIEPSRYTNREKRYIKDANADFNRNSSVPAMKLRVDFAKFRKSAM
jgi:hypothetical protein